MRNQVKTPKRSNKWMLAILLLGALSSVAIVWSTARWSERRGLDQAGQAARTALDLHATTLEGVLEKYRVLPALLARRRDVLALLHAPRDENFLAEVQHIVDIEAAMSGSSAVRVLSLQGDILIASDKVPEASNIPTATPYFQAALQGRLGRGFFGDGKTGGYTFASAVRSDGRIIGIVTASVALDRIEQAWALSRDAIVATDRFGFIYLANRENWRFARLARNASNDQGDEAHLITVKPLNTGQANIVALPALDGTRERRYLQTTKPMPILDWTLYSFTDLAPVRTAAATTTLSVGLVCLLALVGLWVLLERRRTSVQRIRRDRATALRLERRVRDRTKALTREVQERMAAEEHLRTAQAELVQAAKLAGLGQMSASLAHEFNQPLAAIRSLAENAHALIGLQRAPEANDNLTRIMATVDRMGALSKALKTFARKPGSTVSDTDLDAVLQQALTLIGPRLRKSAVELQITKPAQPVIVRAGLIRLEQVIVNLLANAVDATAAAPRQQGRLVIVTIERAADAGHLHVDDNGPGVPEASRGTIFDPFYTTKPVGEGLGLGLSIAYNIVKDFDGTLSVTAAPAGGARFTVTLPLAADNLRDAAE